MKVISVNVFLLLLSVTNIIFCQAVRVGDPCKQTGESGAITLDKNCDYFTKLENSAEQQEHKIFGIQGSNALICCKGAQFSSRVQDFESDTSSEKRARPSTTTRRTTKATKRVYYTTSDPIALDDGIESLCDTIGPYPGRYFSDRILGGIPAEAGEFPHFASLAYRNSETNTVYYGCGGALISHRHVLTAAHCSKTRDKLKYVTLGAISKDLTAGDGHVNVPIKKFTKHPEYREDSKYNDIAIIELESEVTFNNVTWPACLSNDKTLHFGKALTIAGYGRTDVMNLTSFSDKLMKADIEEVPLEECTKVYATAYGGVRIKGLKDGIKDKMLCAKSESADTCQGDSGSGLKFYADNRYYIVGITSFGIACGSPLPSFYTRVSEYVDWIEKVLSQDAD